MQTAINNLNKDYNIEQNNNIEVTHNIIEHRSDDVTKIIFLEILGYDVIFL